MRAEVNEAVVLLLSVKLGKSGCWPLAPFFFFPPWELEKEVHCPDINQEKDATSQTNNCELGLSEGITCVLISGAAFWPSPGGACCTVVVYPISLASCVELPPC